MAFHGLIIESKISAKDMDTLNRSVVAEDDVDGGSLLALAYPTEVGSDVWAVTKPATGATSGLWMAYNPTNRKLKVADDLVFANLSNDDRRYTNLAGETFDAFKPKVGDEIEFSTECLADTSVANDIVTGDILESKEDSYKLARQPKATGATANHTAFEVEYVKKYVFAKKKIGNNFVKFFRAVCVAE